MSCKKRLWSLFSALLAMIMLASCGAPAEESTAVDSTDAENEPEVIQPADEPSEISRVEPIGNDGSYGIYFADGRSVTFDSASAEKVYRHAVAEGFEGDLSQWLRLTVEEADKALYRGTGIGALAFGEALADMLENYTAYFAARGEIMERQTEVIAQEGYVNEKGTKGANSSTQTYRYTQKIDVEAGQVFELLSEGTSLPMRFAVAYKDGVVATDLSMIDTACATTVYEVPEGVTQVVATFRAVEGPVVARVMGKDNAKPALRAETDKDALAALINGEQAAGEPHLFASISSLENGYLTLEENHIMHNKTLKVIFNTSGLEEGEVVRLGHGEASYGGSAVEITKTHVRVYYYSTQLEEKLNSPHRMDIKGQIVVTVKVGIARATLSVDNGEEVYNSRSFMWGGRNGNIFVKSEGAYLQNVEMEWSCSDYDKEIWLAGDSYFNTADEKRWPFYLNNDGYTEYLMMGFPGRKTPDALADLKVALQYGTPKYVVWCMGMNNGDSEVGVNANWKRATEEFLAICEEKGIVPILSTTPNTPKANNYFKNEYVKASGYRYIDFAEAVGGTVKGSPWYNGMLSGDGVHPAASGAKALYEQVLKDFPEIAVK